MELRIIYFSCSSKALNIRIKPKKMYAARYSESNATLIFSLIQHNAISAQFSNDLSTFLLSTSKKNKSYKIENISFKTKN